MNSEIFVNEVSNKLQEQTKKLKTVTSSVTRLENKLRRKTNNYDEAKANEIKFRNIAKMQHEDW